MHHRLGGRPVVAGSGLPDEAPWRISGRAIDAGRRGAVFGLGCIAGHRLRAVNC